MVSAVDISQYAPQFQIEVNSVRLSSDISNLISNVTVAQELNTLNSFSFEVNDELTEQGFRWLGHELFKFGNAAAVWMGYAPKLVKLAEGKIQNIAASFTQRVAPTFTVEGSDSAYIFLRTPSEAVTFHDRTDSQIARAIAEKANLDAQIDRTAEVTPTKTKKGGTSYFEFLSELAGRIGYEFALSGRTLSFTAPRTESEAVRSFAWGKDLISFHPRLNTGKLLTDVVVKAWDQTGRKPIEVRVRAGEERAQGGGRQLASQIARGIYGEVVRVISDKPARSAVDARQIAQAELDRASDSFIEGSAETVGIPELRPGLCVALEGLGSWFSGKYYVTSSTHRIAADGFHSTLRLRRNAL